MYESKKLAELLKYSEIEDLQGYESFMNDFEVFQCKMNISNKKKQLVVYNEDILPRILNINDQDFGY